MKSPSDQQHRTLHYVEVIYLENMRYQKRKHEHYTEQEARNMFLRTMNKFKEENKNAIICLRHENHELIKSELV